MPPSPPPAALVFPTETGRGCSHGRARPAPEPGPAPGRAEGGGLRPREDRPDPPRSSAAIADSLAREPAGARSGLGRVARDGAGRAGPRGWPPRKLAPAVIANGRTAASCPPGRRLGSRARLVGVPSRGLTWSRGRNPLTARLPAGPRRVGGRTGPRPLQVRPRRGRTGQE